MKLPTTVKEFEEFLQIKEELEDKILDIGSLVNPKLYSCLDEYGLDNEYDIYANTSEYESGYGYDCKSVKSVKFPVEYLTMTKEEIIEIEQEKQLRKRLAKEEQRRLEKEKQLKAKEEKERVEYERLKAKYEPTMKDVDDFKQIVNEESLKGLAEEMFVLRKEK